MTTLPSPPRKDDYKMNNLFLLLILASISSASAFTTIPNTRTPALYSSVPKIHTKQNVQAFQHIQLSTNPRSLSLSTTKASTTRLQNSPSGIDEWPIIAQASVFFGTYIGLGIGTTLLSKALEIISQSPSLIGLEKWRKYVTSSSLPMILGLFYLAAGIGHFAASESFVSIYPPQGTWGLWYLPGSAEFHVAWTGLVEGLGGIGLLIGAIRSLLGLDEQQEEKYITEVQQEDSLLEFLVKWITPVSSMMLFVLTLVVTPANIYMYTHGAIMGGDPLNFSFHYIRFGVQVILLSLLWRLALDSFFFTWGDELD